MFLPLVFLFTVLPALEIFLLFKIGGEIGGMNTFLIVVLTGIVGASLAKSQGLAILTQIQTEMSKGGIPAKPIIHGLMVFAGGLLLLTPGFLTDIFGFSLVMPGPRHILYFWVQKLLEKAAKSGRFQVHTFSAGRAQNPFEQANMSRKKDFEVSGDVIEAEFERKE